MNTVREFFSVILFAAGVFLLLQILTDGFSWVYVSGSAVCFVLAYLIWPSKKRGQRQESNWFLDILEFVIELPIEIIVNSFRLLARLVKSKDGFDIDL